MLSLFPYLRSNEEDVSPYLSEKFEGLGIKTNLDGLLELAYDVCLVRAAGFVEIPAYWGMYAGSPATRSTDERVSVR